MGCRRWRPTGESLCRVTGGIEIPLDGMALTVLEVSGDTSMGKESLGGDDGLGVPEASYL